VPGLPYHHLDWRALVRSALTHRGWTQRELAQRVGMSEANLSVLLKGRGRRLGAEWSPAFCAALNLGEHEARWFTALVDRESDSERARDAAELYLRTRLAQLRSATPEQDVVDAQGDWRVNVIQELASCEGFRPDPAWIARALEPEITVAEAAAAWETLLRTGLVRPRDDGGFDVVSVRTESVLAPSQALAGLRMQTSVFDLVQRGWRVFRGNERHGRRDHDGVVGGGRHAGPAAAARARAGAGPAGGRGRRTPEPGVRPDHPVGPDLELHRFGRRLHCE
jgi:uncharacterized protein (TIGR02147 family)